MLVQTFLHFDGRCEEALQFYARVLGAAIGDMIRFDEMPGGSGESPHPRRPGNQIMYASFQLGDATVMASDDGEKGVKPSGFSLTVTDRDEANVERIFAELSDGGTVRTALTSTFFSPKFGQLIDRFGVAWMILMPSTSEPG